MDEATANEVRFMVDTPGWREFYLPLLDTEMGRVQALMLLDQAERPAPKNSDDYLRGYARGIRFAASRVNELLKDSEQVVLDRGGVEPAGAGSPYTAPEVQG